VSVRTPARRFILPADLAKEVLLCFFQAYFAENDTDFKWSPNMEESRIYICDKFGFNQQVAEQRPGIFTDRTGMRWGDRHIDQLLTRSGISGSPIYNTKIDVDITCMCVSKQGLEAEYLAQLIWLQTMIHKEFFRADSRVLNVFSTQVGRETIIRTDSEIDLMAVPVGFTVELNMAFGRFPQDAPLLESIRLSLLDPLKIGQLKQFAQNLAAK
jgi:hypothetical protein